MRPRPGYLQGRLCAPRPRVAGDGYNHERQNCDQDGQDKVGQPPADERPKHCASNLATGQAGTLGHWHQGHCIGALVDGEQVAWRGQRGSMAAAASGLTADMYISRTGEQAGQN